MERQKKGRKRMELSEPQQTRHDELALALQAVKLPVRYDSVYATDFVLFGKGDIPTIVRRLCEAHFLQNYCDFPRGFANAKSSEPRRLPRHKWLAHLRNCVLKTANLDTFPEKWPWIEDEETTQRTYDQCLQPTSPTDVSNG
jgi:hypothetical protein